MTIQMISWLCVIGFSAGVLSGLVGVGGGIILVPALVFLIGFNQQQAQGTSLGLLLLPAGILAVRNYYKNGWINFRVIAVLAVGFVIGAGLGSRWALLFQPEKMKQLFGVLLLITAIKMMDIDKMIIQRFRR